MFSLHAAIDNIPYGAKVLVVTDWPRGIQYTGSSPERVSMAGSGQRSRHKMSRYHRSGNSSATASLSA